MGFQLVTNLYDVAGDEIDKISWVTGSDSSALAIAKDVANILGARFHPMQKVKAGKDEFQVWEKMVIREQEVVLHIEELITTSTTSIRVRKGIREAHEYEINFFPYLPVLVFRPQKGKDISTIDNSKVVPALSYETFVVDPKEEKCSLCAKGSKDLPAKGKNWEKLISSM